MACIHHFIALTAYLSLSWVASASAADVTISGALWQRLQPRTPPPPPPTRPVLHQADLDLWVEGAAVEVRGQYRVHAPDGGWLTVTLPRPVTQFVAQSGVLPVEATVDLAWGTDLGFPRVYGEVRIHGDAVLRNGVPLGNGRFWSKGEPLILDRPRPTPPRGDLIFGESALGVTVADDVVRHHARLRWRVARGSAPTEVAFELPTTSPDLTLSGPLLASWRREGSDRIVATLTQSERALVELEARWTLPTRPDDPVRADPPRLDGTFRTTRALHLAADGTYELTSGALPGTGSAIAGAALPTWAQGLVDGRAVGAYLSDSPARTNVRIGLLRAEPSTSPATVVDVADYRVALNAEGHILIRAHYAVRNDRAGSLALNVPPGLSILSVRVGEAPAKLTRDGDRWRIPLARSVETLQGLISFPVEVTLMGEGSPWSRRDDRDLSLPTIHAPIAVCRATVFLPPGYEAREPVSANVVSEFTEGAGITYGFAANDARVAQSDALFQNAVQAWMDNDFSRADALLNEIDNLQGTNENVERLRSNLNYVLDGQVDGDQAQAKRVKELARARAGSLVEEQQAAVQKAEEHLLAGDYARAATRYEEALTLGTTLEQLADEADTEIAARNTALREEMEALGTPPRPKAKPTQTPAIPPQDGVTITYHYQSGDVTVAAKQKAVDVESTSRSVALTKEFLDKIPSGRSYQNAATFAAGVQDNGTGSPDRSASPQTVAPAPPSVIAASMSVIVPSQGDVVRYQRRLLPAGAKDAVPLRSRRHKRGER